MADILIRNLDDKIHERLKAAAESHGVSIVEEARRILTEKLSWDREKWLREADDFVARQKPASKSAAELIREDRDSR